MWDLYVYIIDIGHIAQINLQECTQISKKQLWLTLLLVGYLLIECPWFEPGKYVYLYDFVF